MYCHQQQQKWRVKYSSVDEGEVEVGGEGFEEDLNRYVFKAQTFDRKFFRTKLALIP